MSDKHACSIVIDTNQFFGDWTLSSSRWENLEKYISLTEASLCFPEIVWSEIAENYINEAIKKQKAANSAIQNYVDHRDFYIYVTHQISHHRPNSNEVKLLDGQNWNDIQVAYLAWLKQKLRLNKQNYISTQRTWFDKIIHRALKHAKPFGSESDKGFKDTILWLSILELANKNGYKDNPIVLISSNTKDFCDAGGKVLHPSLLQEAKSLGLDLRYFKSLDSFLDDWPKSVLSAESVILNNVNESFIRKYAFAEVEKELSSKYGFKVNPKQLEISNFNYFVKDENNLKTVDISFSGYVDFGREFMHLMEISGNLIFEIDVNNVPITLLNANIVLFYPE